ncbi:bifunctional adenosylcobinamide kinase/adenosylcobinamide-phosphate guanylyltransferase [Rhodoferax sp.]|uniref:bifunctional adenosylcobinamide kinase/adenosylcobinamide-phosphate guanylyltransferase n=1 Tax=Rhodoferax sp. TaxID=50421 RepID=UPI00262EAF68|nr:bifunctional adenosylcobinamide kinase/adenosylcobinamide-phosphate guanylyltransferase [Rhodoferax sp.]MDD2808123.1 bifunctional adenosylcobinamide kinase/adenosylcobinamide-phosphate guanylyltransferase [Rhodoferax sp.]MDD4942479.1 bifunctional adenosylcobinamide kinase/adenosylcobinamide-phosphate guanylyltransferase [Rhodoferax sp.]MDD5480686.1 bifunctional adenosylcobinamide kinase/adenosylcobinamide-phosphate guanylyltransferase [Rhodoferax sp.]
MNALTTAFTIARSELILGGQKSGKSRRAEALAQRWLAQSGAHQAVLIATAQAWDDEMRARIARHQADRLMRVPGMTTVEEPLKLAEAILSHSRADTLIVVDCLTLWLTHLLMPFDVPPDVTPPAHAALATAGQGVQNCEQNKPLEHEQKAPTAMLLKAIEGAPGPLVLVGNEIGLGVIPLGREVRAFVDALGMLNQSVASQCQRVTLMAAGLPLTLKDAA